MALLDALLTVIAPVLVVLAVGAILGRRFRIDAAIISKIGLHALSPALCLQTILTTKIDLRTGLVLMGTFTAATFAGVGVGWLAGLREGSRTRHSMMVAVAIGNNGNMGLPIALFALGQKGFDEAVLCFITSVILTFVVGPLVYGASNGPREAVRGMLRLPALYAIAAGLLVRISGVHLPVGLSRGIALLASATLPMILLALGIQLGTRGRVRFTRAVAAATLARVLVMPLVALAAGVVAGIRGLPLETLVLAFAMPTAVNAFLLAHEYDGDVDTVADTVTVTTFAAFASAAVVTALLPVIGTL